MGQMTGLSADLVFDIMGRIDGPTMASVSCTCHDLREAARNQELWRRACQARWPSTLILESDSIKPDFKRLYAESYPLVLYGSNPTENNKEGDRRVHETFDFRGFTSMVDVYYKGTCIFSRATVPVDHTCFSSYPFWWDILELPQNDGTVNMHADSDAEHDMDPGHRVTQLEEELRLSWLLLDKTTGKSVNLSSSAPVSSRRTWWDGAGTYRVHFSSILPAEGSFVVHGITKCTIAVTCKLRGEVGVPELQEVRLYIEDLTGKHLNGKQSLMVLRQALLCTRTTDKIKVREAFRQYEKKKTELLRKKEFMDRVAIGLFAAIQVTVFVALVCDYISRFT